MTVLVWLVNNLLHFHDFIQSVALVHLLENAAWSNTCSIIMTALFCFLSELFLMCYRPKPSIYLAFCKSYILLMAFICARIRPVLSKREIPDANANRVLLHYRSFRYHVIRFENCMALDAVTINFFFSLGPLAFSNSIFNLWKVTNLLNIL